MADLASTTTTGVIIPSVEQCVRQLHDLERWFGTAGLEQALTSWQADKDVRARLRFLHQDEDDQATIDALNRMRRLGGTELADELEANWKAAPPLLVAEPISPQVVAFPVRAAGGAA